jgi:hypothetical protein
MPTLQAFPGKRHGPKQHPHHDERYENRDDDLALGGPGYDAFSSLYKASVDVHIDAGEAMIWARHFAFDYKHSPMTGWLFALWFAVFPASNGRWTS